MFTYEFPHPAVTVDIVALAIFQDALKVLLVKRESPPYRGRNALPGSFVRVDESLTDTASRVVQEKTNLGFPYVEQLETYGQLGRDPRERVISIAYAAILPSADEITDQDGWTDVKALSKLAFDHNEIVSNAIARIASKLSYSSIGLRFLPTVFTLSEIQSVYEIILGEKIEKRNFRKQLLSKRIIEATGEKTTGASHRPAELFAKKSTDALDYW